MTIAVQTTFEKQRQLNVHSMREVKRKSRNQQMPVCKFEPLQGMHRRRQVRIAYLIVLILK